MHISDDILNLQHHQITERISEFIKNFQFVTGMHDEEIAEQLKLSLMNLQEVKSSKRVPQARALAIFLDNYNISYDLLLKRKIDYQLISTLHKKKSLALPSIYLENSHSYRRAAIYMMDYIEKSYGYSLKRKIMKDVMITENHLKDPYLKNNLKLSVSICKELLSLTRREQVLISMGENFYKNTKSTELGKKIKDSRNISELYQKVIIDLVPGNIENNFSWNFEQVTKRSCVLTGTPTQEIKETTSDYYLNDHAMCLLRKGFLQSLPLFIGKARPQIKQLKSLAHQQESDSFLIQF